MYTVHDTLPLDAPENVSDANYTVIGNSTSI